MEWYDKQGQPMSRDQAYRRAGDFDYKRVDLDEIGPYVVSTVWLGLDHRFMGEGPPIIFETMVFTASAWHDEHGHEDPDHEPLIEIDVRRYCTEEEAMAGHQETCLLIRATLDEKALESEENSPSDH